MPKVFISYSWTTPSHEEWVINLAERLVADGVDVAIDKWDLKEGHDIYNFMETMVKSTKIDNVLIIVDIKYAHKANQRTGGVGTEAQIISPKIYGDVSQEKFIPIVSERDELGNVTLPIYLDGRKYIDLSSPESFEENYTNLLRNLYKRPAYNKPKLGKAPNYIFEETPMSHKTSSIIRSFDTQIGKNPQRINTIIRDFLDVFFNDLKEYVINFPNQNQIDIGKSICDNIYLYTPLRNDFILFFDKITKEQISFDIDIIIRFLEKLHSLRYPQGNKTSWSNFEYDNFRFFIHELFLYLIVAGLKNENYKFIEELLYTNYLIVDIYENKKTPETFRAFYNPINTISSYYKETYSKDFINPMADIMIKRIPANYTIDMLAEADLLCHYISTLNNIAIWFPITYIYKESRRFELFDRLISIRHFEKVKILFNISTKKELQDKLAQVQDADKKSGSIRYHSSFDSVIPIYRLIDIEKIGTIR